MSNLRITVPACRFSLAFVLTVLLTGCVTSRIENSRVADTGIEEGESVVIMAKSYHLGNETEAKYLNCIEQSLSRGSNGLRVIPR